MTTVTLLYVDGCPNWELTDRRLRTLTSELGFTLYLGGALLVAGVSGLLRTRGARTISARRAA